MDFEYYIKRYQAKLNARVKRLRDLKEAAQESGFGDTTEIDSRIEAMMNELARLQQVKYDLRETRFDRFMQQSESSSS